MAALTEGIVRGFGKIIRAYVDAEIARHVEPLELELKAVRAQVADLRMLEYRGAWSNGERYERNSLVTHDGSRWIATTPTGVRPGDGHTWRLCVKRGKDGRDARDRSAAA